MTRLDVPTDATTAPLLLRSEVLAAGFTDRTIRRQLSSGEWVWVRQGVYADAATWTARSGAERHRLTTRAVMRQARTHVVASHTSAALMLGAPDFGVDLSTVHLTRLDQRAGRAEAGVRQHRGRLLPDDVISHDGVQVTSGTRTAIESASILEAEAALGVVCSLLHDGHTTTAQIDARYEQMQSHPFTQRSRVVLALASPLIESVGEARTLHLLWRSSIPAPVLQHSITDAGGRELARPDFAWPELKAYLEFDGKVKYGALLEPGESATDVVLREKRREEMIFERTGWRCIRITWADLEHPERTVARIRAFLALNQSVA